MSWNLSPNDNDRLWREEEKASWFQFANPMRYVFFLIALIGILVGLWYVLAPSREWYEKSDLPVIKADQKPYKIKAESQGVPSVQHQDKLVYGRIRADQVESVVEHILPDPEAPSPLIREDDTPLKMVDQYAPEDMDPDKIAEIAQQKSDEKETSPRKSIEDLIAIEDLIEEEPEEQKSSASKISTGNVHIQLGSLKNYDMAESEWGRISKKHEDVLGKREPVIQKVDLGEEKGIYYRLRTGPFDTVDQATQACKALKDQKVECVVVR